MRRGSEGLFLLFCLRNFFFFFSRIEFFFFVVFVSVFVFLFLGVCFLIR